MIDVGASALDDVAALLGAVSWPLATMAIFMFLRRPMLALLNRDHFEASVAGVTVIAKNTAAATDALLRAEHEKHATPDREQLRIEVEQVADSLNDRGRVPQVLWVDDQPGNNRHETRALEELGIEVELAATTIDALAHLTTGRSFDVLISDMDRPPDSRAGYTLLDALRRAGNSIPVVIYSGSDDPSHEAEAVRHGAVGSTSHPTRLVRLIHRGLRQQPTALSRRNRSTPGTTTSAG